MTLISHAKAVCKYVGEPGESRMHLAGAFRSLDVRVRNARRESCVCTHDGRCSNMLGGKSAEIKCTSSLNSIFYNEHEVPLTSYDKLDLELTNQYSQIELNLAALSRNARELFSDFFLFHYDLK